MTLLPGPPLDEDGPVYTVIVLIDHGVIVQSTRASRQRPSIQCRPVTHDIAKARATINAKHWLDLKLTTYTPYLTLTGKLWFVYCERIICGIMVPKYGDFILYLQPCGRVTVSQWLKHFPWYHEVPGPWFNIQMSSYQCRKSVIVTVLIITHHKPVIDHGWVSWPHRTLSRGTSSKGTAVSVTMCSALYSVHVYGNTHLNWYGNQTNIIHRVQMWNAVVFTRIFDLSISGFNMIRGYWSLHFTWDFDKISCY